MAPSCASTSWKHLSKPFIWPGCPVLRKLWHVETTRFKKFMTNLRKWKKAHSLTWLSNVHSETQKATETKRKCRSFAKRAFPSFPRDRWRNCRLISSNSIGYECCLEFVIFSQPMVWVTMMHDWVTTFIVVHRLTTNGYALPILGDPGCLLFSQKIPMEQTLHKGKRLSEFNDQPDENDAYH